MDIPARMSPSMSTVSKVELTSNLNLDLPLANKGTPDPAPSTEIVFKGFDEFYRLLIFFGKKLN